MLSRRCSILVLVFAAAGAGHAAKGALPPGQADRVDSAVKALMSQAGIPGVSIAIVTDGELRWAKGYGMADLENSVPATPDTCYRLASISKTIIAAAVMQLVEQGKLDLDAPIQKYVPAFPQKHWKVTPRELLGHTGGIRTYKGDEKDSTKFFPTLTEAISMFKNDPLAYQPGTKWIYSTQGFTLLALAVQGASGMDFFEYVRKNIFEPNGLASMRRDSVVDLIPHRAYGYMRLKDGEIKNSGLADTSNKPVIVSNATDLAKYANAFLSGKIVKPATLEEMFKIYPVTARPIKDGTVIGYCMGWNVAPRRGNHELEVWKAGNQQRVTGLVYMRPDRKCVIAMLANLEDTILTVSFARRISSIVLGE